MKICSAITSTGNQARKPISTIKEMLTSQDAGEEVLKRQVPEENWVTNWFIKGKREEVKGFLPEAKKVKCSSNRWRFNSL